MKPLACPLNIPTVKFLKDVFITVFPSILKILKLLFSLDSSDLNNFRPMSKLSFLAKILEKAVADQLLYNTHENNIFEKFQSGFRKKT